MLAALLHNEGWGLMKKKNRDKKKQDMPEFHFKEFTPEEDKLYVEAE
jgi:hypothetical protein